MELLDNVRNTRVLLELKRVYSAQVKVYAYIILHDLQVGKSAITFMSRNLDDIDMAFKKISDNLNSSVHTEEMRMRWFTAPCCVKTRFQLWTTCYTAPNILARTLSMVLLPCTQSMLRCSKLQ